MATFVDLFAGLGGFHEAMKESGHTCVFASESDDSLRTLYEKNWGILPAGDIRPIVKASIQSIPNHDILCAGFPCQPFSKAGKQLGRDDKDRGTLFDEIAKILKAKQPKYFILENVPFIARHDNEKTWRYMKRRLEQLGYTVDHRNYSPHEFGIPQHRNRIFIVGSLDGLDHFSFASIDRQKEKVVTVKDFLDSSTTSFRPIPDKNLEIIKLWQRFLDAIPKTVSLPGHPIWAMEFGATYPYEGVPPSRLSSSELSRYRGSFGNHLSGLTKSQQMALLPSYAQVKRKFPAWKVRFIELSRKFYTDNRKHLRSVVREISQLEFQSWQKLEWNVGAAPRDLSQYILQFRASGLRVKKADCFPSLVCTSTQIPIIGWENRYMTKNEGLKLHGMRAIELDLNENAVYRALGNAVNVKIVKLIADELLSFQVDQPDFAESAVA